MMLWLWLSMALAEDRCHYTPTVWNTHRSESRVGEPVDKPRSELTEAEKGPFGCTPCEEDQQQVTLSNGVRFRACKQVAERMADGLEQALKAGVPIESVQGYRPSFSRGDAHPQTGDRMLMSFHGFGIALDVNRAHNGMYNRCVQWGPECVLSQGGPYQPGEPRSLTAGHPVVEALKQRGFSWGGELVGKQKDFMHFVAE